jgi:hypothetical protein
VTIADVRQVALATHRAPVSERNDLEGEARPAARFVGLNEAILSHAALDGAGHANGHTNGILRNPPEGVAR